MVYPRGWKVYLNLVNLILRARSEQAGYAVNECRGMMESWVDKDEAFFNKPGQSKIRIKTTSAFNTQYSNIPPFHYSKGHLKVDSNPLG